MLRFIDLLRLEKGKQELVKDQLAQAKQLASLTKRQHQQSRVLLRKVELPLASSRSSLERLAAEEKLIHRLVKEMVKTEARIRRLESKASRGREAVKRR